MSKLNKKIRLGIDARTLSERGGVRNYVINLIDNLKKYKELEIIVFYNKKSLLGSFKGVKEIALFPKYKFLLPLYDLFILPITALFLKIDVLHLPKSTSNFFPIKKITTLHDLIPIIHPETETFLNHLYWKLSFFMTILFSDIIITDSEYSKKSIEKYYKKILNKEIKVINLGVDHKLFYKHTQGEIDSIRKKYGLQNKYILAVGTIQPRKNIKRYVETLEKINSNKKFNLKLVLVGRYGWRFNKEILNNPDIIHLDSVDNKDLSIIYSSSHIVLFASLVEGFGLPVLEAQACGAPVITSKNSPMEELVENSAFMVNPFSVNDIVNKVKSLLNDDKKRKKLTKLGLLNVKKYNWDLTVNKTVDVYREFFK